MHYFKMNIGDYAKRAGRLTMIEHGAYTLLIHACYDRERFPTLEEALEWCWARTPEEEAAIKFVLTKFFNLERGVYVQKRIQEEIYKYQENAETNRRIALEREENRRKRARTEHEPCSDQNEPCESVNEPPPNQEPRTKNQEQLTNKPKNHLKTIDRKSDDFDRFWQAYPKKVDKKKTATAFQYVKTDIETILQALAWQNKSQQWLQGYIPSPLKYLHGELWNDEPIPEIRPQQPVYQSNQQIKMNANRAFFAGLKKQENFIDGEVIEYATFAKQLGR